MVAITTANILASNIKFGEECCSGLLLAPPGPVTDREGEGMGLGWVGFGWDVVGRGEGGLGGGVGRLARVCIHFRRVNSGSRAAPRPCY